MTQTTRQAEQGTMRPSDESNKEQLRLARVQGDALQQAIDNMVNKEAHGALQKAGDYEIGYAVEHAEGMYTFNSAGELEWHNPDQENAHIEVVVRDAADGRFIPALTVEATLIDSQGQEVGTHQQPFLWHPWLYHYGRNWQVPGSGEYTLRIRVAAPDFPRHDKTNGKRYAAPVEVVFNKVHIDAGRKLS